MPYLSPALSGGGGIIECYFFNLVPGVRQGSVLSPSPFALYMDDIARKLLPVVSAVTCLFMYADDLFLIVPYVHTLQIMLNVCETELSWLGMRINLTKIRMHAFWVAF